MRELWADVEGYPSYMVSDHGRIRNWKTGLELTPKPYSYTGYLCIYLSKGSRRKPDSAMFYIHELVAQIFSDFVPEGKIASHVDGNKRNNHIDNLKWVNPPEDIQRRIVHVDGINPLKAVGLVRIVETGEVFRGLKACAQHIGGSAGAISECLRGKRGTHKGFTFERTGVVQ